ncbi:hypothetical protein KL945_002873 [Ogataea haglerorum]|nr:hypothetical protein KL945_002873 [Ogataea haglerorum]
MLHCVKQYLLLHGRHRICFQGAEIIVWTDDNVVATQLCSIGSTNLRNAASKANSRPSKPVTVKEHKLNALDSAAQVSGCGSIATLSVAVLFVPARIHPKTNHNLRLLARDQLCSARIPPLPRILHFFAFAAKGSYKHHFRRNSTPQTKIVPA